MTEPELQRAAELLAANALWVLALAILVALLVLLAVLGSLRRLRRHRESIRRGFTAVLRYARRYGVIERSLARSKAFLPGPYLALHLVLGLAVTAAITFFVVIAEDVIGGGERQRVPLTGSCLAGARSAYWRARFQSALLPCAVPLAALE